MVTPTPAPTRRSLLRAAGLSALGLSAAAAVTGCAEAQPSAAPTTQGSATMNPTPSTLATKPLLVYFSRAGENYWEGGRRRLEVGNTAVIAQLIGDRIDCEVFEIRAADPYPEAYSATVERNQREQNADDRPRIAGELPDLSGYDTVLIGSPVWNTRAPMIIQTFLDGTSALAGKRLLPFPTYAVGQGSVVSDYQRWCPDAQVGPGLAIRGEEAREAGSRVDDWLRSAGLTS